MAKHDCSAVERAGTCRGLRAESGVGEYGCSVVKRPSPQSSSSSSSSCCRWPSGRKVEKEGDECIVLDLASDAQLEGESQAPGGQREETEEEGGRSDEKVHLWRRGGRKEGGGGHVFFLKQCEERWEEHYLTHATRPPPHTRTHLRPFLPSPPTRHMVCTRWQRLPSGTRVSRVSVRAAV